MSPLRTLYAIASASLLATACSGSNLVDIDTSHLPGSSSGISGSGPTSPGSSGSPGGSSGSPGGSSGSPGGSSGSSSSGGGTPTPSGDDGSAADDTGTSSGGSSMDATVEAGSPGDGSIQDATAPDTGSTPPLDAGDTFACGPTLRCDPASEYCYVAPVAVGPIGPVEDIVVPLDASSRYSCLSLPACDASDVCICIQGGSSILAGPNIVPTTQCSCSDSGGDITRTCTNSGITPLN